MGGPFGGFLGRNCSTREYIRWWLDGKKRSPSVDHETATDQVRRNEKKRNEARHGDPRLRYRVTFRRFSVDSRSRLLTRVRSIRRNLRRNLERGDGNLGSRGVFRSFPSLVERADGPNLGEFARPSFAAELILWHALGMEFGLNRFPKPSKSR